jgi:hypothetical protein
MKRQLVLDQMAKDPNRRQGPSMIKENIRFYTGYNLTRYECQCALGVLKFISVP